jgi:hypothetical protein
VQSLAEQQSERRSSDLASLSLRLPADNRQQLLEMHSRRLSVVIAQCLQRRNLSLQPWRKKMQQFTKDTVWNLADLPKSTFWLSSSTSAIDPSVEAGERRTAGRFKVNDDGVLEPFVRVVGLGDGRPEDSDCFSGVMFEGNIVNRRMKV